MKQDFGSIEYKPLYLYMSLTHISKPFYSLTCNESFSAFSRSDDVDVDVDVDVDIEIEWI